jgi:predicted membrane protein
MRMGPGLLIGVLIILFGLGIIINVVFHVNIPIFKVLIGLVLIYAGLRIILGDWLPCHIGHWRSGDSAVFNNRTYHGLSGDSSEYNAVFGKAVVDLRGIELKEKITRVKVSAVFGGVEIILDENMPVRVKADTVFGGVKLPDNVAGAFGTASYKSGNFDESENYLLIEGASVFGSIEIHY